MADRGIRVPCGEATESFIDFARTLNDDDWARRVPRTPLGNPRDALSQVSGIPDDGVGERADGVATEPWTASQVDRNAGFTVDGWFTFGPSKSTIDE